MADACVPVTHTRLGDLSALHGLGERMAQAREVRVGVDLGKDRRRVDEDSAAYRPLEEIELAVRRL